MLLSVDARTTVVFSRDPQEPECEVCSVDGSTPNCSPTEKTLTDVRNLTLEFSCLKPQNIYSLKIKKTIGESCFYRFQKEIDILVHFKFKVC